MRKTILIGAGFIIVAGSGYYALSPLFKSVEVQDELPEGIIERASTDTPNSISSGLESLSPEEQAALRAQMEAKHAEGPMEMNDTMPAALPEPPAPTSFPVMGTRGHPAEGTVRVIETTEENVIRYENFKTINGPGLRVYVAKDLAATEYIDLGPIRGTEGNINYSVSKDIDLSEYRYVMYWCVPFGILFNYADLAS